VPSQSYFSGLFTEIHRLLGRSVGIDIRQERFLHDLVEVFLHTIALEPARWTPKKVSQNLSVLLPRIAGAGFRTVEVFEPHLGGEAGWPEIRNLLRECGLKPAILSSYVNLLTLSEEELPRAADTLEKTLRFFAFSKVRIFPGPRISPSDDAAVTTFTRRLSWLAGRLEGMEILLETHDLSIADDPDRIVRVVRDIGAPQVGLLFQPTVFDGKSELLQFARQKEFVRHVHLQNRDSAMRFVPLAEGVTPWKAILRDLPAGVNASLEFVPAGICPEEQFDLEAVLAQVKSEAAFVRQGV
jgi:sugar phosphate isomerase/epimerase